MGAGDSPGGGPLSRGLPLTLSELVAPDQGRYDERVEFIVLCSSRGPTFPAALDAIAEGSLTAKCLGLVADQRDRGAAEKAERADIPVRIAEKAEGEDREAYDRRIDAAIRDLVVLQPNTKKQSTKNVVIACMGWMHILSPWFIREWRNRIINVHPALLPQFGGKGMYGRHVHDAVLAAKAKESGMTIHLVDEGVDTGTILLQKTCPVLPHDTAETLQTKVQALEREWYPRVLEMIERGEILLPDA